MQLGMHRSCGTSCTPCLDSPATVTGATRFGTNFIILERVVVVKTYLEELVNHATWKKWARKKKVKSRAAAAAELIKGTSFWKKAENLLKLLE